MVRASNYVVRFTEAEVKFLARLTKGSRKKLEVEGFAAIELVDHCTMKLELLLSTLPKESR